MRGAADQWTPSGGRVTSGQVPGKKRSVRWLSAVVQPPSPLTPRSRASPLTLVVTHIAAGHTPSMGLPSPIRRYQARPPLLSAASMRPLPFSFGPLPESDSEPGDATGARDPRRCGRRPRALAGWQASHAGSHHREPRPLCFRPLQENVRRCHPSPWCSAFWISPVLLPPPARSQEVAHHET